MQEWVFYRYLGKGVDFGRCYYREGLVIFIVFLVYQFYLDQLQLYGQGQEQSLYFDYMNIVVVVWNMNFFQFVMFYLLLVVCFQFSFK